MPTRHRSASVRPPLAPVCGAAALLMAASALWGQPVISERFDSQAAGLNGWTFYADASNLTWEATGGSPWGGGGGGGCIRAVDLNTGVLWGFLAPAAFLGNKGAYYGGTITWDVRTTHSVSTYAVRADLVLESPGLTLVYNSPGNPPVNAWSSNSATLTPAGWTVSSVNGAAATEAQLRAVLANLTALKLNCEWSEQVDTGRLDNVVLTPPTAPACPADLGSTGGAPGPDGELDNNDFIVFIDYFFNQNSAADLGRTGGVAPGDGVFDNNDFVVFIDLFFGGC